MMGKSKVKTFLFSFLLAAVAACLSVAFVACKGGDKDKSAGKYGAGEEGIYYYDKDSSTEYLMTLQSGVYMISMDGASGYNGTYSYDDESKSVSFVASDGDAFEASFTDDVMQLAIAGTPYTFLKKVDYAVRFMDGTSVVGTQSVTYGKNTSKIDVEKDGYIFVGWYEDAAFTTQYGFNTAVTGDVTLYARYVKIDSTVANFDVTFVMDGVAVYETKTQNGVVYDMYDTEGVLGWWVSDTNSADALTYRYNGEVLTESVKLFAVGEGSLGASIYDDRMTWEGSASSVIVTIEGMEPFTATGNPYYYDFSALSTGTYNITVEAQGYGEEELVYVSNALSRVSNFSVYGTTLVYNAVENAQYYKVSVTCGNPSHDHEMVYNGNTLTYDFSNCEMGKDGISFTVYACAQGYVESVSETYVYALILDGTTVTIDKATDMASWTAVSGASGYEVCINGEYAATTTNTEYSLKYYNIGDQIAVSVKPVAPGYWSEESAAAEYTKATLKAPEITGINEYTVSWTEIEEATNYIIYVNGKQIETVGNDIFSYALANDADFVHADSYVITIKAVNADNVSQNSQESDAVYATEDTMSELLVYEDGVVYWQYAMAAGTYYVTVNDENETAIVGQNSFDVTFTQSGENVIKVWFTTESGDSALAQLSVTAYAIVFDSRGGTGVDTIYVAKGDKVYLEELSSDDYEIGMARFVGWYTLPDLSGNYDSTAYAGEGTLFASGTTFDYNSTLVLYAYWEIEQIKVTLNTGSYGTLEGETVYETQIAYGSDTYTLPVPVTDDPGKVFWGWYGSADGKGTRYSDSEGNAISGTHYARSEASTLYAYWITVLVFDTTTYQNDVVAYVEKGGDIDKVTEVTVPDTVTIGGVEYTVALLQNDAFKSCSNLVTVNLPDTMRYISVVNNGYASGTGAFASSKNILNINIVPYEGNYERYYYSVDGVLFARNDLTSSAEILYYPYGRNDASYTVPGTVSNSYEYTDVSETTVAEWPVTTIGTRVFYNHSELESVTIPAAVTMIYSEAFYNCSNLTNVTFEAGENAETLTIESKAFYNCTSLTEITLPSRLGTFDSTIFTGCKALENIYVSGTCGNYSSVDGLLCNAAGTEVIYCPLGRSGVVELGMNGKSASTITSVAEEAFKSCTLITGVVIGEKVAEIGESAFYGCTGMQSLEFEEGDENSSFVELTIEYMAFYGCTNSSFTEVHLPRRLVYLGESAFGNCSRLTTVYYDSWDGATVDELSGLQSYAFCTTVSSSGTRTSYVTTIVLGANVPAINFAAIFGGSKLQTVVIDENNQNFSQSEDGTLIFDKEEKTLIYCVVATEGRVTLPETVTAIADSAFYGCTAITDVVLNDGIETIGEQAFYGCTALKTINFPEGLKTIGDEAFYNCKALVSVSLPSTLEWLGSYDSNGTLTSMNVFEGCSSLESITVAEGNTNFMTKDGVLYLVNGGAATELLFCPINNAVAEIEIPSTVTNIVASAFKNNNGITKVSFVDGKVDGELTIGDKAFQGANNLETIELPVGLTTIGDQMFYQCYSLKNVTIPYTVTSIGKQAFYQCTALEYAIFEETPEEEEEQELTFTVGTSATSGGTFALTDNLIYVNIPDRATNMAAYMFSQSGIQYIVIGAGVKELPTYCFNKVTNLQSVQFGEHENSDVQLTSFKSYAFAYADGCFDLVLPEGFESFGGTDFYVSEGIRSIYIPKTVTTLKSQEFYECYNLEEVIFEDGIGIDENGEFITTLKIESMMFNVCTSLKSIEIPACMTKIGNSAFADCSSLTEVTFLTYNGVSALSGMDRFAFGNTPITEFAFPDTDQTREDGGLIAFTDSYGEIFRWCDYLTTITLSNGIQENLGYALGQACHLTTVNMGTCTAYKKDGNIVYKEGGEIAVIVGDLGSTLSLPWGITSISDYAFQYLNTLKYVTIPTSVEYIGQYAFDGCTKLESVTFYTQTGTDSEGNPYESAESLEIGLCCFRNCTALKEITLPESATDIGTSSSGKEFQGCTSLEKVILSSKTVRLGGYMFDQCSSLTVVTYTGDTGYSAAVDYSSTGYMSFPSTLRHMGQRCFQASGIITATVPAGTSGTSSSASSYFGNYAFQNCTRLETVVFETGADTLNTYAFCGCTALKSVTIPDTITSIPAYCFQNCTSLETVSLPSTVTSFGNYSFTGCTSLTSISLANLTSSSFTTLADYMFSGCTALASVVLPANITSTGKNTFENCTSLATVDASNIISYGNYTFAGCTALESFAFPEGTTTIGTYLFQNCTALGSVQLNGTYTSLGNYMFDGCTSLKNIDIPDRITHLGTYSFRNSGLEEFTLPTKLAGIGTSATAYSVTGSAYTFYGCTNLKKIVLNSDLKGISGYVFQNCTSLKIVTYVGDPDYSAANEDYYMQNGYFAIPSSMVSVGTYAFAGSGIATLTLPKLTATSGTTNGIGSHAFDGCTSLVSVTFSDESTRMGEYMFVGCTSLLNVTVPASIASLGSYQFQGCTSLEDVTFLGSGTTISEGAFQGCTSLLEIYIPDGADSISDYTFDGCSSLASVEFSDEITYIGACAFRNCTSLAVTKLPEFLETIGDYAFFGTGLTEVTIPEFVTEIGVAAFSGCKNLVTIAVDEYNGVLEAINNSTMLLDADGKLISVAAALTGDVAISGNEISEIGQDAFYGATGITGITLSGVSVIGAYAFEGMALTSVTIAADVAEIGDYAFYGMSTLTSVTFASGTALVSIGAYAFAGTSLTSVTIPSTVKTIGGHAFDGTAITSITLGSSLESVGEYAFANTTKLTSATINCDAEIGEGTFSGCTALSSVIFSGQIAISDYMFSGCSALTSVALTGVTGIGAHAFEGTGIAQLALTGTVTYVGDYAFNGLETLTQATLSTSLKTIGEYAFAGTSISSIVLTAGVEEISDYAFYGCEKLASADLSAAATLSIGAYAFAECPALTSLIVDSNTTLSIGDYAFANDTGVVALSISYENTVRIGVGAFTGWTSGQTVTIDTTEYLACHKWMEWEDKASAGEPALEMWLYYTDATFVFTED